jgi:hypothetical protein
MITSQLTTILTSAGCDQVFYESDKLANLVLDQTNQYDVFGLIVQPNEITLEVKANAIIEHYPPITLEILMQSRLEDSAVNNETKFANLVLVCKKIIRYLIDSGEYRQIKSLTISKVWENKYDANLVGWSMPLDLILVLNETADPCL